MLLLGEALTGMEGCEKQGNDEKKGAGVLPGESSHRR